MPPEVPGLVAHLFRHQAGRLVAVLTRALGSRHLQLAEDVVQDALLTALHTWPLRGVPDNPPAWLLQVARRKALDALRHDRTWATKVEPVIRHLHAVEADEQLALDDTLALMFMTCHPALPPESRLALTLKVASGFHVDEIARALLSESRAVAQRLVRAKRQLRDDGHEAVLPVDHDLAARLDSVLDALGLMFTAGYGARDGDTLIREDLCAEATRLARLLTRHPRTATPATHAQAALFLLQAARLPARLTEDGDLAVLAEQNRDRWLTPLVMEAHQHLDLAAQGSVRSVWHVQAGIAALHTMTPAGATPWGAIVTLYDDLLALQPTAIVRLNRAIAVGMRDGASAGLDAMRTLCDEPKLTTYHLLHAARGHFLRQTGDTSAARAAYGRALACPVSAPERRFLLARLAEC